MSDHDTFERQLSDALAAYAEEMPVRVSGAAVAARVAGERRRTWALLGGFEAPSRGPLPLVAWLALIGLLLALLAGTVAVGARLLQQSRESVPNHGITDVGMGAADQPQAVLGDDGYVWLLDASGLVRFDPATHERRTWTATESLDFLDAAGIVPAGGGGAWLIKSSGTTFRRFDGAQLGDAEALPPGASVLAALSESADGTLWAATDAGLFRRTAGVWAPVPSAPGAMIHTLLDDGSGGLWAATVDAARSSGSGVGHYDGHTWTAFARDATGVPFGEDAILASDRAGGVWVGSSTGLAHFDGTAWTQFGAADLGSSGPWMAAVDAAGTTWAVTTSQPGPIVVARLRHGSWQHWSAQDGLPGRGGADSSSASIVVTSAGPLVATPSAAYRLAGDRWTTVWQDTAPPSTAVAGLAPATGFDAWWWTQVEPSSPSADETKLWHHSLAGIEQVELPAGLADVRAIAVGTGGELWLATGSGLAVLTSGGWSVVDVRPTATVTVAGDGAIWAMGPDGSMRTIRGGPAAWVVSDVANSTTGLPVAPPEGPRLVIDGEGQPWAVPVGGRSWVPVPGVWRHDATGWVQMPLPGGAPAETFSLHLAAAHDGSIWVTLDGSVHRTANSSGAELPDPAAQVARYHNGQWTTFGAAAGLPNIPARLSLAITPDGSVWLSTVRGLYRFDEPAGRWRLEIGDHDFGEIVAAPDGALWSRENWLGGGPMLRIASPGS